MGGKSAGGRPGAGAPGAPGAGGSGRFRSYRAALAHPVLRRLLPGFAVSALGDGMSAVAVAWLALRIAPAPSRELWTGAAVAAYALPGAVGTVALRRWLRRSPSVRVAGADATLRALALGAIPCVAATGVLCPLVYVALLALSSLLAAWGVAGQYTLIAESLTGAQRVAGNSLLALIAQVSFIGGPIIAGLLSAAFGPAAVVAVDAASWAVLAGSYAWVARVRAAPGPGPGWNTGPPGAATGFAPDGLSPATGFPPDGPSATTGFTSAGPLAATRFAADGPDAAIGFLPDGAPAGALVPDRLGLEPGSPPPGLGLPYDRDGSSSQDVPYDRGEPDGWGKPHGRSEPYGRGEPYGRREPYGQDALLETAGGRTGETDPERVPRTAGLTGTAALAASGAARAAEGTGRRGPGHGRPGHGDPDQSAKAVLRANPALAGLLVLSFAFYALYGPVQVALPVYVDINLHGSATVLGLFWSAYGLGAALGSLAAPALRRWSMWCTMTSIVFGWGLALLPFGLQLPLWGGLLALFAGGVSFGPWISLSMATFQETSPPWALTQLLAVRSSVLVIAAPAGTALAGPLVATLGARGALFGSGVATVALAACSIVALVIRRRYFR